MSLFKDTSLNHKFLNPKLRQGSYCVDSTGRKPNIIFITVDMISPDCYFDTRPLSKVINTPNIDLIAAEGTRGLTGRIPRALYVDQPGPRCLPGCTLLI